MHSRRAFVSFLCATSILTPLAASAGTDVIPISAELRPEQLADLLKGGAERPAILQVGFKTLYDQAHIEGARYAGPANKEDGIANLNAQAQNMARDKPVVIYCGCCPWERCPNMGQAWQALHAAGFTDVKALYIAGNFGDDWVGKGYPVARGG
jgi:thiosulfate/3-mercaptopyruvate sulfurtransferase